MSLNLIKPEALADELKVTIGTLAKWRLLGGGPRYVKLGKNIRYDLADVAEWVDSRKLHSTAERRSA